MCWKECVLFTIAMESIGPNSQHFKIIFTEKLLVDPYFCPLTLLVLCSEVAMRQLHLRLDAVDILQGKYYFSCKY